MRYNNIRTTRESKNISQQTIADYLNITRQQYHLYESGKREIPAHLLKKIADYYSTSIDYLVLDAEETTTDNLTSATFREINDSISDRYEKIEKIIETDRDKYKALKWVLSQYKRNHINTLCYLEKQLDAITNK